MLEFSALYKAIQTLEDALQEAAGQPHDLLARDGCIQRFEYTYELCVKSLRRQLEDMSDSTDSVDTLGYKDMLRMAFERGLVTDVTAWFGYRELRNTTSHAYNPGKAAQVFSALPEFLASAQALGARLLESRGA